MAAAPGWYPDPNNAAVERYWNGAAYTEQRAAKPAKTWPAGWYAVVGDSTIQREWDGRQWTGTTRPTKKTLGVVVGGNPKKANAAAAQFAAHIQRLRAAQAAGRRGDGRIAWVAAYATVEEAYGPDSPTVWARALASIRFNSAFVRSPAIGSIPARVGVMEVYEDFVIFGTQSLDTTRNSGLAVLQEGQKQVTVTKHRRQEGSGKRDTASARSTHRLRPGDRPIRIATCRHPSRSRPTRSADRCAVQRPGSGARAVRGHRIGFERVG